MAAVKWNQDLNAGQDWFADINVLDTEGVARDITGFTFESLVKRHYKSINSIPITVTVVNPITGNITLALTAAQTSLLKHGKYLYDIEMTHTASGYVERIIQGVITIRPEITK
tara:strand:+ start:561 stop:899 length:339 start_codon:yes stop_codon:yes gene_type:complete